MEIRPILSAMLRNKTGAVLVALQVAIALAVVCNAGFIVAQRLEKMARPSGYAEAEIITVAVNGYTPDYSVKDAAARDLRELRALSGVAAATIMPFVPLGGSGIGWGYTKTPNADVQDAGVGASLYLVDEHGLDTLGLELVAGRGFRAEEMGEVTQASFAQTPTPSIVVSKAFADQMFPEGDALGKTIYGVGGNPCTIVGIVARAQGLFVNSRGIERSVFAPLMFTGPGSPAYYIVRAAPGRTAEMQKAVEAKLLELDSRRLVREMRTFETVRAEAYRDDRAMTVTLLTVITLLVVMTALGIFGLMAFNVNRRQKQIGTRRALGARKADVVRHFLLESWLLTTLGAAVGVALAVGLSMWLVEQFQLPRLDWRYLPAGVVALWLLGQLAAFGPARRAAGIAPAIATRSV